LPNAVLHRVAVPRIHWDDFSPGQVIDCGSRLITRAEIVAFAAEYDPQPMHLDEHAARATLLGGLVTSGWHSCCILMRMMSDSLLGEAAFMGAPGVEEVKWLAPIRPGERIMARGTVLETRPSRSRPDMGFVKFRFELIGASEQPVMTLIVSPMFGRRAASAAQSEPAGGGS
jgi:acyl dehydratase